MKQLHKNHARSQNCVWLQRLFSNPNGADGIKWKTLADCCYSDSVTCLTRTHFSSLFFCSCQPPPRRLFCTSLSLTSALLAFALLLPFVLISPPTSLLSSHLSSSCHATFLSYPPPSLLFLSTLASHLHYPPPCNCAQIFPLHSNAPPHYCSLCCRWCRRQCWDVQLHQRRLHIASAHFLVVSWSWEWFSRPLSLCPPASCPSFCSFLLPLLLVCVFVCSSSVHMWAWNRVGPFSVILHTESTSRAAAWVAYEHREND